MKCSKCGEKNLEGALFCEKCGNKLTLSPKKKKVKASYITVIVICITILVGSGIWVGSAFSPYNRQVRVGYMLMNDGEYEEAVLAFDKAIEIDDKKSKAYVGKATTYSKTINDDTVRLVSNTLNIGYEQSRSNDIVDAYTEIAKFFDEKGHNELSIGLLQIAFEHTKNERFEKQTIANSEIVISAYKEVIENVDNAPYQEYGLYDIDKNGIPELLLMCSASRGTCMFDVYTFKNDTGENIGTFTTCDIAHNGSLWTMPDENGLLNMYTYSFYVSESDTHRFNEYVNQVIIKDGSIEEITLSEQEVYGDEEPQWTVANTVINGTEVLPLYNVENLVGLYAYFRNYELDLYSAYNDVLTYTKDENYTLFDIDGNDIPELITIKYLEGMVYEWKNYECMVYTVDNGKLRKLGYFNTDDSLYIGEDNNLISMSIIGPGRGTEYGIIKIDNKKVKTDYFMEAVYSVPMTSEGQVNTPTFKYNNSAITEEEFTGKVKSYKVIENFCYSSDRSLLKTVDK